jgi:S1-C subfamily serine protease
MYFLDLILAAVKLALLTAGLVAALTASADRPAAARLTEGDIQDRLLASTGWVVAPHRAASGFDHGTCEVIDAERRLAITAAHVVGDSKTVIVVFPAEVEGRLVSDPIEALKARRTKAKVLARDPRRDLALVQLETLPKGIAALPLAAGPQSDSASYSLGNSGLRGGALWTFRRHTVVDVGTFTIHCDQNTDVTATFVATSTPCAPGDSGGPLVNERGELTGVVQSKNQTHTFAVAIGEVKDFVAQTLLARSAS